MNKSQRRWLWAALGVIVLVLAILFVSHSSQWKAFQWSIVWRSLTHAKPEYLILAIAATYATYVARAYRWQFFLDPLKKASVWNLFVAQILGFSTIYLIGRTGEVVRPAYIARTERVSFTSQIAIWLLERVYDGIAVVLLFALALSAEPVHPASAHAALSLRRMHDGAVVVLILCCVLVAGLVLFRMYSDYALDRLPGLLLWAPRRFRDPLRKIVHSFSTGLEVIQNLRDFLASAGWTVVLWFLNVSIFFLVIRGVGGSLAHLSWGAAAMALFFGAIGLIVQLPGVGGGYQAAIILALQQMFAAPPSQATAAGILIGAIVMLPCMALGVVLLLYEGLTLGKLKSMAESENQVMAGQKAGVHD
ncbi:MAG: lysylphosphatidylglycerol synthase transmembrane domain-containing protein [Terriglobia bacterium]